jgi:hypothetical protein
MKTPKAPDPFETATAQSGMNRDTAVTQHLLNMVNQVTPDGSLTYSQTGQTFTPSDTGSLLYYNPTTGAYSSTRPQVAGGPVSGPAEGEVSDRQYIGTDPTKKGILGGNGGMVYEDGWQEVRGNLTPSFTATTTLSPAQQRLKDQTDAAEFNLAKLANQQSSFLGEYLGQGMDTSGLTGLRSDFGPGFNSSFSNDIGGNYTDTYAGADDFSADRQRYEDALWQRTAGDRDQARAGLETQLINRGLRPGTAAWDSEMNRLASSETDARLATLLAGGQEQSRMVGMARDAAMFGNQANLAKAQFGREGQAMSNSALAQQAGFQNQARAQGMQELFAQRNQPINEIAALLSGSQVNMPQFQSTPQTGVAGVDYTGLVNQKYQSELAASQSAMGGLFGLLGTGLSLFSDSRLKENVKRIGETDGGTPIYTYNYVWGGPTQMGVMAQEAPEDAVSEHESGYLMVDYGKVY